MPDCSASTRTHTTPRAACREELFECDYAAVDWNAARSRCAREDLYYPHPWLQDLVWWVLYKAERVLLGSALRRAALREVMTLVHYEDENTRYIDIGPVNKALNLVCCWFEDPEGEPFKRCGRLRCRCRASRAPGAARTEHVVHVLRHRAAPVAVFVWSGCRASVGAAAECARVCGGRRGLRCAGPPAANVSHAATQVAAEGEPLAGRLPPYARRGCVAQLPQPRRRTDMHKHVWQWRAYMHPDAAHAP